MASTLAIDGGTPIVPEGRVQTWPAFDEKDRQRVMQVFDNNQFHTNGAPMAQELQQRWAAYCGVQHCLVVNGGTSALHMALAAAGVRAGDEVITPAFTYWSTTASILHQNAIPVFGDVDRLTGTLDPGLIEERLSERTTAIMPVHIDGWPADMDPILAIARKHGLAVVDDCCQAHGATYKGRVVGGLADISGFSLNRSKCLTGGEGGLITTDRDDHLARLNAMLVFQNVPWEGGDDPVFSGLGYNYRPHEFINAFVLTQLDHLAERNAIRRQMAAYLNGVVGDLPGLAAIPVPAHVEPVFFGYCFDADPAALGADVTPLQLRTALIDALTAEGVPCGGTYGPPQPAQPVIQAKVGYGRGCPWTCAHGRNVEYHPEEYPATQALCDARMHLRGVNAANDMALIELYAAALEKVGANMGRVVERAKAG